VNKLRLGRTARDPSLPQKNGCAWDDAIEEAEDAVIIQTDTQPTALLRPRNPFPSVIMISIWLSISSLALPAS
jgi:hypothetical protein